MTSRRHDTHDHASTVTKETARMTPLRRLALGLLASGLLVAFAAAPASASPPEQFGPQEFGVYSFSNPIDATFVTGQGTLTAGSNTLTSVTTTSGAFTAGETISTVGIPPETTITAVAAGTLTLSANATLSATERLTSGAPATDAASHPESLTVRMLFNHEVTSEVEGFTENFECECGEPLLSPTEDATIYGSPRTIQVNLPAGLVVDPSATSVRCTEAQIETRPAEGGGCPAASAIGLAEPYLSVFGANARSAVYNMVPPPGVPAEFAFSPAGVGFVVHVFGRLRSGSDYGLSGIAPELTQKLSVYGANLHLFGDPSSSARDPQRDVCANSWSPSGIEQAHEREWFEFGNPQGERFECPLNPDETTEIPFLTMPTACSGSPLSTTMSVDSWQEPATEVEPPASTSSALSGCAGLHFEPEVEARPTTDVADSPSGLDFDLKIPQPESLNTEAEAHLKNAIITLPKGIAVNPSSADGLQGCTTAQIGYKAGTTEPFEFTPAAPECPDASKIGSVVVKSPLLTEVNPDGTVPTDSGGNPIVEALSGSVYLAAQGDNPFHGLLAIYIVVNDPQRGIVVKLPGHVVPDPVTGQLVTTVQENPQLPFEEFKLDFFKGDRAPLSTPATCGRYETTTELTPWSAPDSGLPATPNDEYEITQAPGGGTCPTTAASEPNQPHFSAGTTNPTAGAHTPFVLRLSREPGSQRLTGLDTTLPPGLLGRLAGIAECSDAQIAQAESRSGEGEGALEQSSPSCPASSGLGTITVGTGSGAPFYAHGRAYLAGPYKGAPLSVVTITPALAGPFDLGVVVDRAATYVDPITAQIHAVTDTIPTILDGIPLDIRSVTVRFDRPQFILNPTNCNPLAFTGSALSELGASVPLTTPFQAAACAALPFKPKLAISLKGSTKRTGNPALSAVLTAKPGEAASAAGQVTLPGSEFVDNAHFNTICTNVQFNAAPGNGAQCPPGSIYGRAKVLTPLIDFPEEGNVYLRSNPEPGLPDLVVALHGPAFQPIAIDLVGKVDSGAHNGLRTTFRVIPDAPITRFELHMKGGAKSLLQNSENLCAKHARNRAIVHLTGQNGKHYDTRPKVANSCAKNRKHRGRGAHNMQR